MDNVAFRLVSFRFPAASLNFDIPENAALNVAFTPSGEYSQDTRTYDLKFGVVVTCQETGKDVVRVMCESRFMFNEDVSQNNIPDFFYPNSLAIVFPYVRAFVSNLSLQANVSPIILPTYNLMGLMEELKKNTEVK